MTLYRRTCPADDRCPWRGVIVEEWDGYSGENKVWAHVAYEHPDFDYKTFGYESWERVRAVEPIKARDAVVYLLILGFVAVAVVSVLRLVRG